MDKRQRQKILILLAISISAVLVLAFFLHPASAHAAKLYEVLGADDNTGNVIKNVWRQILNLVNYAMAAVLIFIAFMNILRLDASKYGIKKFLPTMILAVILANFSFLISRLFIDFANVLCDAFINGPRGAGIGTANSGIVGIAGTFQSFNGEYNNFITGTGTFDWAQVFRLFLLTLLEFVGAGAIMVLAFLFLLRNYIIYFLVGIAPIAFMAMVLPQTKKVYDQWWGNFFKWAFMPIVSLFWLWVGNQWLEPLTKNYTSVIAIAFAIATYYMAITTPFKMGGSLMKSYSDFGKKAAGALGGNYLKKQGQVWWSNQGNSNNVMNPLAHIARANAMGKAKMDDMDKRIASNQDAVKGRLIDRTRFGKKLVQGQDAMGGSEDLAKKEHLAKYYDENPDKLKGKSEYNARMATADSRLNTALAKGNENFFGTAQGTAMIDDRFAYQKRLETSNLNIAALDLERARDYYSNKGKWGEPGSKEWKIKNDFEAARQRKTEILEQAVNSQAKDETRVGLGEEFRIFQGNERASRYRQIVELERKIAEETDEQKRGKMQNALESMTKKIVTTYGFNMSDPNQARLAGEQFDEEKANYQTYIEERKTQLQQDIERKYGRDCEGKLNVPYFLRPALELSDDGTTITDIKDLNGLGAKGASRLNKMLGLSIEDESQGYDAKFSPEEMGRQLAMGGDDFTKEDIENYRSGNHDAIGVDELTKIIAMQRAYLKYANRDPRSLENLQFVDKLPDVIAAGGPGELTRVANQVQQTLVKEYMDSNPGVSSADAATAVETVQRTSHNDANGNRLNDAQYITKLAKQPQTRRAVSLVVSQDKYLGNSRPAPESFAGVGSAASYSPGSYSAPVINPGVESAARQMSHALSGAATSQILKIAEDFKKVGASSGTDLGGVIDEARHVIHEQKRVYANKFAQDMGLIAKGASLDPKDRDRLIRIMSKGTTAGAERVAEAISKQFKLTPTSAPTADQIAAAQKIQTAIDNVSKIQYSDMVEQVVAYIPGLAKSSGGPHAKEALTTISKQAGVLSTKVDSASEARDLAPEILIEAKALLQKTGRTKEHIEDLVRDRSKLALALTTASEAAGASASAINQNGVVDMEAAQESLYRKYRTLNSSA